MILDRRIGVLTMINDNVKLVCEAIASVMAMDVTIVDANMLRIAGTGRYKQQLGECISHHSAFEYALATGEGIVIKEPRHHQICKACEGKDTCIEYAEVCCPITLGGVHLGVIGLIAFDEIQRERVISESEQLLVFLKRMADLIAAKASEVQQTMDNLRLVKELESIIDHVDIGLCLVDVNGHVRRQNETAKHLLLWEKQTEITIARLKQLFITCKGPIRNKKIQLTPGRAIVLDLVPIDIKGIREGFLLKVQDVIDVIKTANALTQEPVTTTFDDICGVSNEMVRVKSFAEKISDTPSNVLILGESGTGKELFARAIHNASSRREAPFVAINCAAIPEQLLESELFGYEEGAFTGARKGGKLGKFQLANRGTIFLDEIGDMSLYLQAKLLRVLQEGQIEPIGGHFPHRIDVRIIAATHRVLKEAVLKGSFREDLYYRLSVMPLTIPPLRERKDDITALVKFLLPGLNKRLKSNVVTMSERCYDLFTSYNWPGNVRELENTLEYAVNMCDEQLIREQHLPMHVRENVQVQGFKPSKPVAYETIEAMTQYMIEEALKTYHNDKDQAAKALGISRATLYRKLHKTLDA